MRNKRGSTIVWSFVIMFAALLIAIGIGVTVFSFNLTYESLAIDIEVGQVNLKNITDQTFGQINTGLLDHADTIGIILLLGMCLLMILNGYTIGNKYPKLFIIVDLLLLIIFFIPAFYLSQVYEIFINSTPMFTTVFVNYLPKVSKFVLNLPVITGTVGIITMIVTYAGIKPRETSDVTNVAGF